MDGEFGIKPYFCRFSNNFLSVKILELVPSNKVTRRLQLQYTIRLNKMPPFSYIIPVNLS